MGLLKRLSVDDQVEAPEVEVAPKPSITHQQTNILDSYLNLKERIHYQLI